jgi:hypothetical protein
MAHSPFEAKNVFNADDEPGPTTIYQHDPNADESFIRRVAPAAPGGAIFGLLQYMDAQESAESIQPPARVGVVSQSIASGSFVNSTQGTLSSAVKELQEVMALLRVDLITYAMKIDEKECDWEKPLVRPVGDKMKYTPSKDIKGFYRHTLLFGAAAGLDRGAADARILQHLGAQLIDHQTAREQLDYIEDTTTIQDRIDREDLASAIKQRIAGDPNIPLAISAQAFLEMADGKSLLEAMKTVAPQLIELQQAQQQQAQPQQPAVGPPPTEEAVPGEPIGPPPEGAEDLLDVFAPPPLQQNIVRNPVF